MIDDLVSSPQKPICSHKTVFAVEGLVVVNLPGIFREILGNCGDSVQMVMYGTKEIIRTIQLICS